MTHNEKTILVMDASCAICSWGARVISKRDAGDQFRILPAQTDRGRDLFYANGLNPEDPESWLVLEPDGTVLKDSSAVLAVGRRLTGVWPVLARLGGVFPRVLRDPVYRLVARNRYRLFGRADLCAMPDAELQRRLLTG